MSKWLGIILFVVIAATLVNDVGRYAKASYDLDTITKETADHLLPRGKNSRNDNATEAAAYASQRGATVYLYDQNDTGFTLWTEMPVEGTWILAPVMNYFGGQKLSDVYVVKTEQSGRFR